MANTLPDFNDTQTAYNGLSNEELNRAYFFFRSMKNPLVSGLGQRIMKISMSLGLPVKGLLRKTLYKHFCGGETFDECLPLVEKLAGRHVSSVLDYGVEGQENEKQMDDAVKEIINSITSAAKVDSIPFAVFKPTSIGFFSIYKKVSDESELSTDEKNLWNNIKKRFEKIFRAGIDHNVPVMVDAEESWIQQAIDDVVFENMLRFNRKRSIVWNTFQMYRTDRLDYIEDLYNMTKEENIYLGIKLVRGAYLEKERDKARKDNRVSPVHTEKNDTDRDFNHAVLLCLENIGRTEFCAATHNEESCRFLAEQTGKYNLEPDDQRVWFAQLYGMSDYLSFNLAASGYNISKYIPYGPIEAVIPYLLRRAEENSSVSSQADKEMKLIMKELKRRKKAKSTLKRTSFGK